MWAGMACLIFTASAAALGAAHLIRQRRQEKRRSCRASSHHQSYRYIDPKQYTASNPKWLKDVVQQGPPSQAIMPPPLLHFLDQLQNSSGLPAFGQETRNQLFNHLQTDVAYLNHGSYGAACKVALDVQSWYQQQLEVEPVRFMETVAMPALLSAVAHVAKFVGANPTDIVPVTNATTAVNTVVSSIRLRPGDVLLMFNTTYPAVRSTLARAAITHGARILEVTFTLDDLSKPWTTLDLVKQALTSVPKGRLKLAVLDHVISFPPCQLPVEEMALICRQAGAQVLVDAAHSVGALPYFDVTTMNADYVTSNLHKWCCTPKGAAFLWVSPERQETFSPLVTSHGYGLGMQGEFIWQGTSDLSAWLAVPAALHVLQSFGRHRVAEHNKMLVTEAAKRLVGSWPNHPNLRTLGGEGQYGSMIAVSIPPLRGYTPADGDASVRLHDDLYNVHRIEVPVIHLSGELWVRISAQIYNCLDDYQRLIDVLMGLTEE